MRIELVMCNCKGLCPSFEKVDMTTLPFDADAARRQRHPDVGRRFCSRLHSN